MSNAIKNPLKFGLLAFVFLSLSSVARAADPQCEALPDCESLGYEKDATCESDAAIACPYDVSYKKCVNASCEELGYTQTLKMSWCKDIVYCPTDSTYSLCAHPCGNCSDGQLSPECDYGVILAGVDECSHACYKCRPCDLDVDSGWETGEEECSVSEYVKEKIYPICPENAAGNPRYICASCPFGTKADSTNSSSCGECDKDKGYYYQCPTGALCTPVSTAFGVCQKTYQGGNGDEDGDGCDEAKGWVSTGVSNAHFIFSEDVSHFNIGTEEFSCKQVTGCDFNTDFSTEVESDINKYFDKTSLKIGNKTCFWTTHCKNEYQSSTECSNSKILDPQNSATLDNLSSSLSCGVCICDNANNYFSAEQKQNGISYTDMGDGCFLKGNDCAYGWTRDKSNNHFEYSEEANDDGCYEITGCSGEQGSTLAETNGVSPFDTSYFDVSHTKKGGYECWWITGCAGNKQSACPGDGYELVDYETGYDDFECGTCVCDNDKGYYTPGTCPESVVCEDAGACERATLDCNGENGYILSNSDTHFNYTDETVRVSKVPNASNGVDRTCYHVDSCKFSVQGSVAPSEPGVSPYDEEYFNVSHDTKGGQTCYWVTSGCNGNYKTAAQCSHILGKVLESSPHNSYDGGPVCGTCVCDETNCFKDKPDNGQTTIPSNGCWCYDGGCGTGYANNKTDEIHFKYGTQSGSCWEVVGCAGDEDGYSLENGGSTADSTKYDKNYFQVSDSTVGGLTCYWVTNCKNGLVSSCDATSEEFEDSKNSYESGLTCGTCGCNEDNGYYESTECPESLVCETVGKCKGATNVCNKTNGYVESATDSHFTFSSGVAETTEGGSSKTCYHVDDCKDPYTDQECTGGTYAAESPKLADKQCYKCVASDCDPGEAKDGACPAGYKTGALGTPKGDVQCYKCECDSTQGYYLEAEKVVGVSYEERSGGDGFPTCHVYRSCANGWTNITTTTVDENVFYGTQSFEVVVSANGTKNTCKKYTDCQSSYTQTTCGNNQVTCTGWPKTLDSAPLTCYWCKNNPETACEKPQVCDYVIYSLSAPESDMPRTYKTTLQRAFDKDAFSEALDDYNECRSEYNSCVADNSGCDDFGGVAIGGSVQFTAPNGAGCNPGVIAACRVTEGDVCTASFTGYDDATTTQPTLFGYTYTYFLFAADPGQFCYYNIEENTCAVYDETYPNEQEPTCSDTTKMTYAQSSLQRQVGNSKQYCYTNCYCDTSKDYYDEESLVPVVEGLKVIQSSPCYTYECDTANDWYLEEDFDEVWASDKTASFGENDSQKCYHKSGCKTTYNDYNYYASDTDCPSNHTCTQDENSGCWRDDGCDEDNGYLDRLSYTSNAGCSGTYKPGLASDGAQQNGCYAITGCAANNVDIKSTGSDKYKAWVYDNCNSIVATTRSRNTVECYPFKKCKYYASDDVNETHDNDQIWINTSIYTTREVSDGSNISCPLASSCKWTKIKDCQDDNPGYQCSPVTSGLISGCFGPKYCLEDFEDREDGEGCVPKSCSELSLGNYEYESQDDCLGYHSSWRLCDSSHSYTLGDGSTKTCWDQGNCDNEKGYYNNNTHSAYSYDDHYESDGCYPVTGCRTTTETRYFDKNAETNDKAYKASIIKGQSNVTIIAGTNNEVDCRQFAECKYQTTDPHSVEGVSTIKINTSIYTYEDVTIYQGKTCQLPNGCQYNKQTNCENGGYVCEEVTGDDIQYSGCWIRTGECKKGFKKAGSNCIRMTCQELSDEGNSVFKGGDYPFNTQQDCLDAQQYGEHLCDAYVDYEYGDNIGISCWGEGECDKDAGFYDDIDDMPEGGTSWEGHTSNGCYFPDACDSEHDWWREDDLSVNSNITSYVSQLLTIPDTAYTSYAELECIKIEGCSGSVSVQYWEEHNLDEWFEWGPYDEFCVKPCDLTEEKKDEGYTADEDARYWCEENGGNWVDGPTLYSDYDDDYVRFSCTGQIASVGRCIEEEEPKIECSEFGYRYMDFSELPYDNKLYKKVSVNGQECYDRYQYKNPTKTETLIKFDDDIGTYYGGRFQEYIHVNDWCVPTQDSILIYFPPVDTEYHMTEYGYAGAGRVQTQNAVVGWAGGTAHQYDDIICPNGGKDYQLCCYGQQVSVTDAEVKENNCWSNMLCYNHGYELD